MFFSKSVLAVYPVCPVGVFRPVSEGQIHAVIEKSLSFLGRHSCEHSALSRGPSEAHGPGRGSVTLLPVGSLSPACFSGCTSAQVGVWRRVHSAALRPSLALKAPEAI